MISAVLIFCAVFLFFLGVYLRRRERKERFRVMLLGPPAVSAGESIEPRSVLAAVTRFLKRNFSILFPSETELQEAAKLLIRADMTRFTAEELFAVRQIMAGTLTVGFFLLSFSGANLPMATCMGLAGGLFGYIFPRLYVKGRAEGRQKKAATELIDYIELLSTATEAGLMVHDAIRRVAEYSPGVLSDEFRRAWTVINGGMPRAQAFQSLAKRIDVEDITTFIDDIVHAEKQGTPISQAMKRQAARIREKAKLLAVENAQKAAGKMMFPTLGLIFIPMIILIMAPLVITLGKSFSY